MNRSSEEIAKLLDEWEALRADYMSRGSTGIVDFINAELRKLRAERDAIAIEAVPPPVD